MVEIEPATPYDSNRDHYDSLAALAKREHDEDARPAISAHPQSLSEFIVRRKEMTSFK